jgi:MFS transporter, ACDE family, multidrug resistance protein
MSSLSRHQRTLLALVVATTLTSIMGNSLLAPALPDIVAEFDRPDSAGGLLIAATSLPGIAFAPVIGLLADRFGRRRVLVPCLFTFGAAGIVATTAPTFEIMLLARFVMGFGAAGLVNLAIVLISDTFTGTDRTKWIGFNTGVLTAALAVFPLVSGLVTELAGWRWALAPYGLGLAVAAAALVILPADRPTSAVTVGDQLRGMGDALRNRTILATYVGGALGFAAMFGVFLAVMPTHLEREFGLSAGWRGVIIGLPSVTSSMSAFNLRRIRRRVSARALLISTGALWVVAFLVIGLAGSLLLLAVGTLLYGAAEGAMIPTMQDIAVGEASDANRAAVLATWNGFARLGQTAGPLATGAIVAVGDSGVALLSGALMATALTAVMSTVRPPPARPAVDGVTA